MLMFCAAVIKLPDRFRSEFFPPAILMIQNLLQFWFSVQILQKHKKYYACSDLFAYFRTRLKEVTSFLSLALY